MDLELGLKITKTKDDIASISEYRLAKAGPVFQFRETNTMFILTANLKGYKRNSININISEDGSKISISGEKPVQNILMMGWLMHRKGVDVAGFNKIFKIPDGVKLDGIKAKYDEEEWTLNIFMPKLVKGICGAKIEEIKEEQSDRGKSKLEKSEADQILSTVGETSQKGSRDSEVQAIEKEGELSDKMLDDANRGIIKEALKKEVEESQLGNEGEIGESFGEKGGMEGHEVMKRSELEENVGGGTSQKIGDTSQKEIEECKLRIEDGGVKGMREEVGKTEYGAVKSSEMEKNAGEDMSQSIGDTSQDKEFEVGEMEDSGGFVEEEKVVTEKRIDDANGNIIGEVIQIEIEESKSGIEDREGESVKEKKGKAGYKGMKTSEMEQNVGAHDTQNIGDTSIGVSKESIIEQIREDKSTVEKMEKEESGEKLVEANVSTKEDILGKSKQKQFGEPKPQTKDRLEESVEESMELMETLKAPKLDQNVNDHIPINISKEEFKKSRIQQKEETESIEENMDGGESERMPVEASQDTRKQIFGDSIRKDIKMSKIETQDGDQEYVGEKDGKKEFTIREEFPQQLPKATTEESKGLSASKVQETEDVKEAMIKRKPKKIEYFVDKGEGEQSRRMHMKEKKDLTKETMNESEDVKQAMVEREGQDNECFVDKGEGKERKKMHMKAKKDLTKEKLQESEDVKEAMVKRKGKEIDNYLDQGEEPKRMHIEAKKELTTETMQKPEDVTEVMFKRKDREIESFPDKGEDEEPRRMHMKAKKDMEKERMQENEDVKGVIVKRKGKKIQHFVEKGEGEERKDVKEGLVTREGREIEYFVDKGKGEEPKRETMQENEDVKEAMVKREGKEIEYFVDKGNGEEPKRMDMETKMDLARETMQESEDAKEVMIRREGKEIEYFGDKSEVGEPKKMHEDAMKDLTKKRIQESEDVKEAMIKRKGKKIDYVLDEGESQEPKRIHMDAKEDSTIERMKETEDVKVMVKRKDREIENFAKPDEGEEPKRMLVEAKKDFTGDTMQESEYVKEAIAKRKGKETECFLDKSEGEETKRVHKGAKKDLTTKTMQESEDVKEAKVKRNGKEIDYVLNEGEGEEPNLMHMKAKKDIKKETMQESEDVKEVKVKRKDGEIENFEDKGDGKEPRRMLMKTKKELTKETIEESEDVKEAMVKRKGKEIEYLVDEDEGEEPKRMHMEAKRDLAMETTQKTEDVKEVMVKRKGKEVDYFVGEGEGEEPKRMHIEAKKDSTETMQETQDVNEVMVKRKKKEIENFAEKEGKEPKRTRMEAKKDLTKEKMQESEDLKETMVKRNGKEIDYFVDKGQDEELKRTQMKAKEDVTKETMQEEIEKIKNGIKDNDQQNVLEKTVRRKFEVPTEELPKLVGEKDGLKVAKMDEQKETIKEPESESLMETVKGKKSKKTEEASRVTEKNIATEILQKETEEFKIERKSRDGPFEADNMVKVMFEVLGTFQTKLPKKMMEVIAQNKKDNDEYVIVEVKGEGSIKMHVQPNETSDEDEIEDRIEKDVRKPKLKSCDQISGKENVDVGVFDGSKRPKLLEMAEAKDVKEDSAKIEESVMEVNGDRYEKIRAEEKGGLKKDITRESTQKERKGSKIQTMEKDQHRLQEEMRKRSYEASKVAKEEFPMKMDYSLANIDEAKDAKEELVKKRSEGKKTGVKEKGAEIEQIAKKVKGEKCEKIKIEEKGGLKKDITKEKDQQCLQEEMSKGRYEAGTTAREFPMQIVDTLAETGDEPEDKVVNVGFKEIEQESAKDKNQKTKLLPPTIQSKETNESKFEGVKHDTIKPKKAKTVEGEQSAYNIESVKEVARFPSTQQTKVEGKDKLYEGGKAEAYIESEKDDRTKDVKNFIEMEENQESKQRKTLRPEIHLERHQKKGGPVTRKDEFPKEQRVKETMEEDTEEPKDKVVGRDQQYMQEDFAKKVGKVETKGNLKATLEREKHAIAQNVEDKKARIQEENIKGGVEKVGRKGYQTKAVEGVLKGEHRAEVVPKIEREKLKTANSEEAKEAFRLPLKREMGKTAQTAEDKKPKMGEIAPEFEKASGFEQVAEKLHVRREREHQRESEVAPKGVEKSMEDVSPMPKAIQREELHELSLPIKDYKIPKIEEIQQKKEGARTIHALEATISKEGEELVQATRSKAKSEIDEPQEVQLPSPSIEMWSKEARELDKHGMKEDESKAKSLVQIQEGKESIHSIEGAAKSEVVADEVAEPSKISSSSSTQPFEVEGKDKTDTNHDEESQDSDKDSEINGQESTKSETDEEVEQKETLQPTSPAYQQCINKEKEEGHGTHEEEKAYEHGDEFDQEDSQLLEELRECEEGATAEKNIQKRSKKLFVSLMIAGSALLASGIFLFIRHKRARNRAK